MKISVIVWRIDNSTTLGLWSTIESIWSCHIESLKVTSVDCPAKHEYIYLTLCLCVAHEVVCVSMLTFILTWIVGRWHCSKPHTLDIVVWNNSHKHIECGRFYHQRVASRMWMTSKWATTITRKSLTTTTKYVTSNQKNRRTKYVLR